MNKRPRPVVAKRGTSEYIYQGPKSDHVSKRSFSDQEEDYMISLFCGIKSNFIVAKLLDAITGKRNRNPLGMVVNEVMAIMIAADDDGLLSSKDHNFLRDWITKSVLSEIDHFIKIEGYNYE